MFFNSLFRLATKKKENIKALHYWPPQKAVSAESISISWRHPAQVKPVLLSGVPDYFGRNKISSGGDLSHYSSASLY